MVNHDLLNTKKAKMKENKYKKMSENAARGTRLSVTGSYKCFVIDSDSRWKSGRMDGGPMCDMP